jgi:protease-4
MVGGDTIAASIAAAAADPRIDAIVLRIDSPGGSALASELMAREVFAARARKPVICSMGDVAASGGYFAAAGCQTIFADPMTITGSIGIFNGKVDLSGLLGKLGITWSMAKRGKRADVEGLLRAFSDEERALLKRKLHYFYGRFLRAVARGRGLTETQVDAVGRGHVWTGRQALPIRLVDREGGVGDALALAASMAGIEDLAEVDVIELPRDPAGLLARLLGLGGGAAARSADAGAALEDLLPREARDAIRAAVPASLWVAPDGAQARLPSDVALPD